MAMRRLTFTALFVAIGVLSANIVYIPVGVAKCFPVQHAINVLAAVWLGTRYSVSAAFGISLLRNLLGTGSPLAFPGSMIGAFLAGVMYKKTRHIVGAVAGEIFGTAVLGGLAAYPVAKYFLGVPAGVFFFVVPFLLNTVAGSAVAYLIYHTPVTAFCRDKLGPGAGR